MIHLIERFTDHLKKGRYNTITIKSYRDAVFMFYSKFRDYPQHKIDAQLIADYLREFKEKKAHSPDLIVQNGKALKLFFKVIFDKSFDIEISGEKKQSPPYILSKWEIRKIIDKVRHPKHSLIVQLSYGLGLKLNELINLKRSSIDFEKNLISIGETTDEDELRKLLMPTCLSDKLKAYIDNTEAASDFVFCNKKGEQISPRGVQLYFSKIVEELNIDKSVTLQNLRHSYAVHLLDKGVDLHHLQKSLGHKYLQTTTLYQNLTTFEIEKLESPLEGLL